MDTFANFSIPAVIFVLTIGSGLWLSSLGKPYRAALFNVHKLIALAVVVLSVIQLVKVWNIVDVQALLIAALVVAGIGVVALFATGALLSVGKVSYGVLRVTHIVVAVVMPLTLGLGLYWM
jgi:hypothetical protein